MNDKHLHLAPLYQGWDKYQQHLVKVLAPLSSEQLELHAGSHLRSPGDLARHIIGARARWLYYVLQEGDENLAALGWPRPVLHLKDKTRKGKTPFIPRPFPCLCP